MTIEISGVISDVKRHLSVIGKRLYTKEGKNMFSDITTSTAEDPIFWQYVEAGVETVRSALQPVLGKLELNAAVQTLDVTFRNERAEAGAENYVGNHVKTYLTLYTLGEYLGSVRPESAEKYRAGADSIMTALQMYAYHKEPPVAASQSYNDINGTTV